MKTLPYYLLEYNQTYSSVPKHTSLLYCHAFVHDVALLKCYSLPFI